MLKRWRARHDPNMSWEDTVARRLDRIVYALFGIAAILIAGSGVQWVAGKHSDAEYRYNQCLSSNVSRAEIKAEIQFVAAELGLPKDLLAHLLERQEANLPQRVCEQFKPSWNPFR